MSYNFILGPVDTDSISICKPDMSPFTEEEQQSLINEINALMPQKIQYAHDGYFQRCVALKAKNYVLFDGKKIKIKGSALKSSTKSPRLKQFVKDVINIMCYAETDDERNTKLLGVYNEIVKEVNYLQDIKPWASRKTLSSTMKTSTRTNETKVMDALVGSNYTEGDRFFTFFLNNDNLCLVENFTGDYNKTRLFKSIHDTISIFDTVLDVKNLFPNYALKRNQKLLEAL